MTSASLSAPYIGRFAPSPTGPLHLGSLVTAVASYLEAQSQGGLWLVRIEDLDPPREPPGTAPLILNTLQAHGLQWHGDVLFQSQRSAAYEAALAQLLESGKVFPCACTRTQLAASGHLHHGPCPRPAPGQPYALRLQVDNRRRQFQDQGFGLQQQNLAAEVGDFILKRKEGLYAYQLAVVVDDAFQKVSHVLRGADLLDNTLRQRYLQECLGIPHPAYWHIPLVCNEQGQKLSKQNLAPGLDNHQACNNLRQALSFLHQPPPPEYLTTPSALLAYAKNHWQADRINVLC